MYNNYYLPSQPFYRVMKEQITGYKPEGVWRYDSKVLTDNQIKNIKTISLGNQILDELYLQDHNEIIGMATLMVQDKYSSCKQLDSLKKLSMDMVRPKEEIEADLKGFMKLPFPKHFKKPYTETDVLNDLLDLNKHRYDTEFRVPITPELTPITLSSSFLSICTSAFTIPTREPTPIPEPTIYEIFYSMVSTQCDKAIFAHVSERELKYDTAYTELMKAVEIAMEIPVLPIREDLRNLWEQAYKNFLDCLDCKDNIAAAIAWEKRMRKKLKRTLRRRNNFRGYESPPTPKSEISSHESYKKPMLRPCKCHPPFYYNRYPKDRFGIYLPRETQFSEMSVTTSWSISMENLAQEDAK